MNPHLEQAAYENGLGGEGHARVRAASGPNDARLLDVKQAYDPLNVSLCKQNIASAPSEFA